MELDQLIDKNSSKWMDGSGPDNSIVISSRVRLARNLQDYKFPHCMSEEDAKAVLDLADKAIANSETQWQEELYLYQLNNQMLLEQQILMEKHLISPNFIKQAKPKGLIVNQDDSLSIMINEEDHLRIQCLLPGLQLEKAWETADQVDDYLEETLDYAFDPTLGYLTACPSNVGTGFRASVMLHLPGLVIAGQAAKILSFLSQIGLTVRGIYGEGTEAKGNLFQISNQITLGIDEREIVNNLHVVTKQLIEQEEKAREKLLEQGGQRLADRVLRAYGILKYARLISSNEAISLLSDLRLGIDTGFIQGLEGRILTELMVLTSPGYLQKTAGRELSSEERDARRAEVIRNKISNS